ncbi:MAG TPA: tripartite tricarboxylate transporter TctB family protein [Burkholderiales bacterium]|nr:tripartite tricarboxylate transporter TctB family protein [Burkholderiales bacterium]
MRYRSGDFWSGLALAALGGYIVYAARGWEYLGQDGPGPGFFPLWYGIAMLVLSLVLVFSRDEGQKVDWRGSGRAFATWAAFAVSVVLLKVAGFVVGFAALTFFMVAVMYRRPLAVAALVAVGATAGFYLVFPLALGVQLP